jgi:hypothetical protein
VNFLSSFALSATGKDHGLHLDFYFGKIEKCKRMVVVSGNNRDSAFYEG